MRSLQQALFLSDKGYSDLKKAVFACTLTNLALLLPFCVTVMIFSEIPFAICKRWRDSLESHLAALGRGRRFSGAGFSGGEERLPQNLYRIL